MPHSSSSGSAANGGKNAAVVKPLLKKPRLPEDTPPTWREELADVVALMGTRNARTGLLGVLLVSVLTGVLSIGYLSSDSVIDANGLSKQNFRAPYTIEVVDQEETQRRVDEAQLRVDTSPVYLPSRPFNQAIEDNLTRLLTQIADARRQMEAINKAPNGSGKSKTAQQQALLQDFQESVVVTDPSDARFLADRVVAKPMSDDAWYRIKSAAEYTVLDRLIPRGLTNEDYLIKLQPIIAKELPPTLRRSDRVVVTAIASSVMSPTLRLDEREMHRLRTQAAAEVVPVVRKYRKGEKIINEGERVTSTTARALETIGQPVNGANWRACIGVALLSGFFTLLGWLYLYQANNRQYYRPNYAAMIVALTGLFAAMFAVMNRLNAMEGVPLTLYFYPLACYGLLLSIFMTPRIGIAFTTLLVFLLVMTLKVQFYSLGVLLFGSYVAIYAMNSRQYLTDRGQLLLVGTFAGLCHMGLIGAMELVVNVHAWQYTPQITHALAEMAVGAANGLLVTVVTLGMLPVFESVFGLVTPYMLMELANHDKPLLKRMQFEAPGTFHHSLMVASLSEAAAEAIGANALLTRVGSLYHDIGKMKRPLFFVENQAYFGVENPHDKLSPRLSKMVITAHTRDSIEMAKHHHLPEVLQAFMTEHHGTMTTGYFYNQACLQEGTENVSKEQFRYAGPKPQSRETAIVMMADACESAVRSLKTPTPAQIEERIDKIVQGRIDDEQFDECPITFEDLRVIKATFFRVLRGIQHNRIEYQQNLLKDLGKRMPEPGRANLARLQQAIGATNVPPMAPPAVSPPEAS